MRAWPVLVMSVAGMARTGAPAKAGTCLIRHGAGPPAGSTCACARIPTRERIYGKARLAAGSPFPAGDFAGRERTAA